MRPVKLEPRSDGYKPSPTRLPKGLPYPAHAPDAGTVHSLREHSVAKIKKQASRAGRAATLWPFYYFAQARLPLSLTALQAGSENVRDIDRQTPKEFPHGHRRQGLGTSLDGQGSGCFAEGMHKDCSTLDQSRHPACTKGRTGLETAT